MSLINLKKTNLIIRNILKDDKIATTKVYFFFSTKAASELYDPYEKRFAYTNLNPLCLKMYARDIDAESLIWRQMGTQETGAKEIICEEKYSNYFRLANKIEIDGDTYEVYKEAVGGRVSIQKTPLKLIRVILQKK